MRLIIGIAGLHVCLWLFAFPAAAQQNTPYHAMLKMICSGSVQTVSPTELRNIQNTVVLDSREREEHTVSHIDGSVWVGFDTFDPETVKHLPKDTTIVVYCSVGYRSEKIGEQLLAMGFTKVYNLYGGIFEWVNLGYPVVDMDGQPTNRIHAYSKTWGVWLTRGEKVF